MELLPENSMGHLILYLTSLCVVKSLAGLLGAVWDMVNPWSSDFCTWISTSGWPLFIREGMGTWESFSSTPQLSQRGIPSAFFISFDRLFLIETMNCVFANNQGKARAGGRWDFNSLCVTVPGSVSNVSLMSSCVHWEHHFMEDNISWLPRCAAIRIWSCSDNNHLAVLLVFSYSATSQGQQPAFW